MPRHGLGKAARHVKRFALLQHVIASTGELVRERLDCNHIVGLRLLAFIEPLRLGAIAHGKVSGLNKRPGQILVAVLGIAFPLLLPVAGVPAIDATGIEGKVARAGKTIDGSRFQQDGRCQHRSNARDARKRDRNLALL